MTNDTVVKSRLRHGMNILEKLGADKLSIICKLTLYQFVLVDCFLARFKAQGQFLQEGNLFSIEHYLFSDPL